MLNSLSTFRLHREANTDDPQDPLHQHLLQDKLVGNTAYTIITLHFNP